MGGNTFIIICFVIYLLVMLYIGWWGGKKSVGTNGYYVANRRCGTWLSIGTFTGSFISAVAVMGYTGNGFAKGYMTMINTLGCVFSFYLIYFFFLKPIKSRFDNLCTIPELFENMYGSKAMSVITSTVVAGLFVATLVSQIKGGSLVCSNILGFDYKTSLLIITIVFVAYTVMGGMYSVVYTDLIQTAVLVLGIIIATPVAIKMVGGFSAMNDQIAVINPIAIDPIGTVGGYWSMISTFISFGFGIAATQYYLIRIYSAKDMKTARRMVSGSSAIYCVVGACLVFLGICAKIIVPDSPVADSAILDLAQHLPLAIRTCLLLGIVCAIMSTTDTILLAAATYLGRDLYRIVRPNLTEEQSLKSTKICVGVIGLIAAVLALNPPELIITLTTFTTGVTASGFFAPMFLGFYWKKTTREGALCGMAGGIILAILYQIFNTTPIPVAGFGVVVSFALTMFVSLVGPKDHPVALPPVKKDD